MWDQQLGLHHIDTDHAGTPKAMYAHESGEEVWSTDHETYGKTRDTSAKYSHPVTGQPFEPGLRLQGQYEDQETGLYQNLHRYYDPQCGRYVTQDPIGLMGGLNAYRYCPNPVGYVDPLGLSDKECIKTKSYTKPDGTVVERSYVRTDALLERAKAAAGRNLDSFVIRKVSEDGSTFYRSPDNLMEIEWSPAGHITTNEGPHVSVKAIDPSTGRASVVDKYFIEHWYEYKPSPEYWINQ